VAGLPVPDGTQNSLLLTELAGSALAPRDETSGSNGSNEPDESAPSCARTDSTLPATTTAKSQQQLSSHEHDDEVPAAANERETAAAALRAIGAGDTLIRELLDLPSGPFYTLLWVTEIAPTKPRWHLPLGDPKRYDRVGFVLTAVRECCLKRQGKWFDEAQGWIGAKREKELAAEKRQRTAAPQPVFPSQLPPSVPELGPLRRELILAAFASDQPRLRRTAATEMARDPPCLILVAGDADLVRDLNRRILPKTLRLIRRSQPDFPNVEARLWAPDC